MSVTVLCIFGFAYSRLSTVIDELRVRRFHFILLSVKLDGGVVTVLDLRRKDPKDYADMSAMIQKYVQSLSHHIGNFHSFPDIK